MRRGWSQLVDQRVAPPEIFETHLRPTNVRRHWFVFARFHGTGSLTGSIRLDHLIRGGRSWGGAEA